jgi:hypothetical protein
LVVCDTTISFSATIKNSGVTPITSCIINYKLDAGTVNTYTWTGSLSQGASTAFSLPNFTGFGIGTHTLTVYTSAPNNGIDYNAANDKQTTTFIAEPMSALPAPVVQGFTVTTFPPVGWVRHNALGGASMWARATTGNAPTTGNSARYPFYQNGYDGDIDEMYLQSVDLTTITSPQLRFDYAYNYYDDGSGGIVYDSLNIQISTDCGATWSSLFLDGGPGMTTAATQGDANEYSPAASEWVTKTIDLTFPIDYSASNDVLIKYSALNHYGNDMYIDNINIVNSVTGITQNNDGISGVKVYPNPASNQFNLNVNLTNAQKTTVTLYNLMGQVVFTKNYDFTIGVNLVTIQTEQLAAGMYTILITSVSDVYQTKISLLK